MSFGAGHLGRSVQANLKLKGERKTYFDRTPGKIRKPKRIRLKEPRPKISVQGLLIFRKELQRERRKLRIRRVALAILLMCILLIVLRYFNGGPL